MTRSDLFDLIDAHGARGVSEVTSNMGEHVGDLPVAQSAWGHDVREGFASDLDGAVEAVQEHADELGGIPGHPFGFGDWRVDAGQSLACGLVTIQAKMFVDSFTG